MYLLYSRSDIFGIITDTLRTVCAWLCEIIYGHLSDLYQLFTDMGLLFYNDTFSGIYGKISLIIGVFMVFRVSFWMIELLVSPDKLTDKEKSPTKIIQKVLVSVVLLAITPTLFEYAFKIQYEIVDSHLIEKIINIGNEKIEPDETGKFLSAELFSGFYTIGENFKDDKCAVYTDTSRFYGESIYTNFYYKGKANISNSCLNKVDDIKDDNGIKTETYVIDFNGLIAVAVGIFVFIMILMYCISIATRYVQLIYLQVIAPIPIMCYLTPNKDNMLSKWVKQCTTTYLDLFIRIGIINFVMLLVRVVLQDNNLLQLPSNFYIKIFLILGLLTFAKKAPDLIQELLPKSVTKASGDFGLSWKKRTDAMLGGKYVYGAPKKALGFGLATMGVLRNTAVRAYNAHQYNKRQDEKIGSYRNREIARLNDLRTNAMNNLNKRENDLKNIIRDSKEKINDNSLSNDVKKKARADLKHANAELRNLRTARPEIDANLNNRIETLKNASNANLRNNLLNENANLIDAYNRIKDDPTKREQAAQLMEKISANQASGVGHRNQVTTFATSVFSGMVNAGSATIHGKNVGDIVKKSNESQVKKIIAEQKWYGDNGYTFSNVVQRTVSEVQRKFGIETEGQTIQYILDDLDGDIKSQKEIISIEKEKQQSYSSGKKSTKQIESEGLGDCGKGKAILSVSDVDENGNVIREDITLMERINKMRTSMARTDEYFKNADINERKKLFTRNTEKKKSDGTVEYEYSPTQQVIENLVETICKNSSDSKTTRENIDNYLNSDEAKSHSFEEVSNKLLSFSNQTIGKSEGDYGKMQAGAALLYHIVSEHNPSLKTQLDSFGTYNSQEISNEYDEMLRDYQKNPSRFANTQMASYINELESLKNSTITDFNEKKYDEVRKTLGKLKDEYTNAVAEQTRIVNTATDGLQATEHYQTAFRNYSETRNASEADKFNGGK